MPLSTYAELKTSVLSWLARPGDPLVEPSVPDMVKLFEAEANRRLRTIDAEKSATLAVNASGYAVLPADCWGVRRVSLDGVVLQYVAPGAAPFVTTAGESYFYTLLGVNTGGLPGQSGIWTEFRLLLGPMVANQTGLVEVIYQVGVPPLGDTRPSNWLLTNHCDAYLWGVLAEAELFIGHDERAPMWLQRREQVFQSIEAFDRKTRWAGPLQVRVDAITTPARGSGGAAGEGAVVPLPDGGTSARVHIGEAPPANSVAGDLWWDSSSAAGGGQLYIYYLDPTGGQWVAATNQQVAAAGVVSLTPASGEVVTLTPEAPNVYVSSGALPALTIRLPVTPPLDRLVQVGFANPVEALTVQDGSGLSVAGAPTSAYGPGAALLFRWVPPWVFWK